MDLSLSCRYAAPGDVPTFPSPPLAFNLTDFVLLNELNEVDGRDDVAAAVTVVDANNNNNNNDDAHASTHAQSATRGELVEMVARTAAALRLVGVKHDERVAVIARDSMQLAALILAVVKLGAQLQPIRPIHKLDATLPSVMNTSRACFLACAENDLADVLALTPKLPFLETVIAMDTVTVTATDATNQGGVRVACLTALIQSLPPLVKLPPTTTTADDVAILSMTSGTTGPPKLVLHAQTDYCFAAETYAKHVLQLSPRDVVSSSLPAAGTYVIPAVLWFPLRHGATSVLTRGDPTPQAVLRILRTHNVTVHVSSPVKLDALVAHLDSLSTVPALPHLRIVVSAGAVLPSPVLTRFQSHFPHVHVLDGMGASEMGHIFISNVPGDVVPGSVGRLVPGYSFELRESSPSSASTSVSSDEKPPLVPLNHVGELWIRGSSGLGYLNRKSESRQTFVGEWCHTRDAYTFDGTRFVFHGRTDDILKMASQRVSPFEVEELVLKHVPGVRQACLVACGAAHVPTLFVVLGADADADADDAELLRRVSAAVRAHTDAFKVPSVVRRLEALPVTAAAKVDRAALRRVEVV